LHTPVLVFAEGKESLCPPGEACTRRIEDEGIPGVGAARALNRRLHLPPSPRSAVGIEARNKGARAVQNINASHVIILPVARVPHGSRNLPVVIKIVDSEAKIDDFLPILDAMMAGGLVTLEKVQSPLTGRPTAWANARFIDISRSPG